MQNSSIIYVLVVIIIAFIAGYSIVSFLLKVFKRLSKNEGTETKHAYQNNKSSLSPNAVKDERYYAKILGFNGPVSVDDVKHRYRELVSQYHPDKVDRLGPELKQGVAQKTSEINEAYEYFKKKYRIT